MTDIPTQQGVVRVIGSDVTVQGVIKSFGDFKALKGVSLQINKGEFFSLLGPSGCGKTTLLRILAGFENPDSGVVMLDSSDILPLPPNKRPINTVFQNYALFPHLSVYENIAFPLRLRKTSAKELDARVWEMLDLVHLKEHVNKKPQQLSGGQRQRVAIARALINRPNVLLLDEPLSALDAKLRQQLLVDLDELHDAVGITFIYVTHDQAEALGVSDRVAVMNKGEVLQVGAPHEIYEAPATTFVAEFIGETNTLEGTITKVEGDVIYIDTQGLGIVEVTAEGNWQVGERVVHSIRPEKIRISKERPSHEQKDDNVFHGKVHERIYFGHQSKFYVNIDSGLKFKVFKQHVNYMDMGPLIKWDDEVYVAWDADDGYIVERVRA